MRVALSKAIKESVTKQPAPERKKAPQPETEGVQIVTKQAIVEI
jgi:hypothetical protein